MHTLAVELCIKKNRSYFNDFEKAARVHFDLWLCNSIPDD